MTLSDTTAYRQVIGCLMKNPLLLLEYTDIYPDDFDDKVIKICFINIKALYQEGAIVLTPIEVDQEIDKHTNSAIIYKNENGLDFLKSAYEVSQLDNFKMFYTRLKKYSLLRRLHKEKYDISEFYIDDKDIDDPLEATKIQEHFDNSTIEQILNSVEGRFNIIRNEYLNGGRMKGDPAEGIFNLIDELQKTPNIGPSLEGKLFSTACRGAREGCFYLKSASSGCGKSRTAIFDACHLAYPVRWSYEQNNFVKETIKNGEYREPRKVLFIVTEMDKEELQTIILAYLSGVNETHILTGKYDEPEGFGTFNELDRVKYAAHIMEEYSGYFIIEEISDPNLVNIQSTIRKYATMDEVKYIFFDYIHTTASLVNQFERNGLREDVVLMLLSNQLKQLAKDYNLFIMSATQVNANAMTEDGEFKNETSIRASKAIVDKADVGFVMTKVNDKIWNSIIPQLKLAVEAGELDLDIIQNEINRPTHIIDIYKMRRGRYKNVRIWINLDLGTGRRKDLFMTNADNQPIGDVIDLFSSATEEVINNWKEAI